MTGLLTGGRDHLVKSPDLTATPVILTPYVNWLVLVPTLPQPVILPHAPRPPRPGQRSRPRWRPARARAHTHVGLLSYLRTRPHRPFQARALSYGDALNAAALRCLNEYAVAAGRAGGRALADLNAHFSPLGVRYPKDAAAVGLVRDVARELGGCR
eukprot:360667-Chlamydomonas_euryale.AAC.16